MPLLSLSDTLGWGFFLPIGERAKKILYLTKIIVF